MTPLLYTRTLGPPALALVIALGAGPLAADSAPPVDGEEEIRHPSKLPRDPSPPTPPKPPGAGPPGTPIPGEIRSLDGRGNNLTIPHWGIAQEVLLRVVAPDYGDGASAPAGADRPGAREISNAVCNQTELVPNRHGASDFLWQWGQFLDHDIDETPGTNPAEYFNIEVSDGDPWLGGGVIPLNRSAYRTINGVRQQVNFITSFIDASNVYGSNFWRAVTLRSLDGTGTLKTTPSPHGDLLPYNDRGFPNAQGPGPAEDYFFAGDVRANEQAGLTAMHTLFVREHNFWASQFVKLNPDADDEECYQFARMIVGAEMQAITYREFLPVLLGPDALPPYRGYNPDVNPTISNAFATSAYRLGHSLLSPTLLRLDRFGQEIPAGHLPLAHAFFYPPHIEDEGIDPLLRGLARQRCQELDMMLVDDVRNMLFGQSGPAFDLAALNIQRGRDHGLPAYIAMCEDLGLAPASQFQDINPDPEVWQRLAAVYDSVDDIDAWVGGLCEPHAPGAMTGPMVREILIDQFTRLRDGDRFFYKAHLPFMLAELVEQQTLARIIRRNTDIRSDIPDNVFLVIEPIAPPSPEVQPVPMPTQSGKGEKRGRSNKRRKSGRGGD